MDRLIEPELGALEMAHRDNALLREAGFSLAEAALRVVRDYDGLHHERRNPMTPLDTRRGVKLLLSQWIEVERINIARSQSTPDILRSEK